MYTYVPRHIAAGWLQDNWAANNRLTLNLGVRYDLQTGVFAQEFGDPALGEKWARGHE